MILNWSLFEKSLNENSVPSPYLQEKYPTYFAIYLGPSQTSKMMLSAKIAEL